MLALSPSARKACVGLAECFAETRVPAMLQCQASQNSAHGLLAFVLTARFSVFHFPLTLSGFPAAPDLEVGSEGVPCCLMGLDPPPREPYPW